MRKSNRAVLGKKLRGFNVCGFLLAVFLLLAGCREPVEPTETLPSSTTTAESQKHASDEPLAKKPVWSSSLFVKDEVLYYVHPTTGCLMRYDLKEEEGGAIWSLPVYESFFLSGDRLYVRNQRDGHLYSLSTDGGDVEKLFSIPFEQGLMLGDAMYLLARPEGELAVLYMYQPKHAYWSVYVLDGSDDLASDMFVFGSDVFYYVQESGGRETLVARRLETGTKEEVYHALYPGKGQLHSLVWRDGVLYFIDEGAGLCSLDGKGQITRLPTQGDRVLAVLEDGFLLGNSDIGHDAIFYGNREGQEVEFFGGIVQAAYGMRAIIARRNQAGTERVSLVKYPEDEEQQTFTGSLAALRAGQQYALAMFYDTDGYAFINLSTGQTELIAGTKIEPQNVSIDTYLSEKTDKYQTPSQEEVAGAAPVRLAQVYAAAVSRNDRYTLRLLSSNAAKVPLYYPLEASGFQLNKLEETDKRLVYALDFSGYASTGHIAFLPSNLRQARLILTKTAAGWKVDLE